MDVGFIALVILAFIHLFANQAKILGWLWHGRFLSFAAGISFAYVFVDLLPELEKEQPVLKQTFDTLIPYLDRHAYVIALIGVLFFYGLHTRSQTKSARNFWISTTGYLLFNFFVGASLSDSTDPELQPLALFTVAMGMHYFIWDHNASIDNNKIYEKQARWLLVAALFTGYIVGYLSHIPEAIVAVTVSFIAGGVLLNVLRYELPKREQVGYLFFVMGSLLYTAIILNLGSHAVEIAESDRAWLTKFVHEFFLDDTMVFTLFGSKPMGGQLICTATEEESLASSEQVLKNYPEDKKQTFLNRIHEYYQHCDLDKNFSKWLQWKKQFPQSLFLFRSQSSEDGYYLLVEMLNVREAIWTLQKHYTLFQRETGMEFDPLAVCFDFENPEKLTLMNILSLPPNPRVHFFKTSPTRKQFKISRYRILYPLQPL